MALEVIGSAKSKSTPKTFGEFCTNLPGVNEPVNWMTGDDYCEHALEHYNETQGVNFELVKVVGFAPIFVAYYTCFHFNFLAKPKDGDDQSPRLFFAEVCDSFMGKYVNICMILDPSSPDTTNGCPICDELLHPKDAVYNRVPANFPDSE